MIVRPWIEEYVELQHDAATLDYAGRADKAYLHPSNVGFCRRKAILKAAEHFPDHPLHYDTTGKPFDLYTKQVIRSGRVWEDANAGAFLRMGGYHKYIMTVPPWSGEADYYVPQHDLIIEHKATASWNFSTSESKRRLPYTHHLVQVVCYIILYERLRGRAPQAALYYTDGRDKWAEFDIRFNRSEIDWEGEINGYWAAGLEPWDVESEMRAIAIDWKNGVLPPKPVDPFQLDTSFGNCVKQNRRGTFRACPWFDFCWEGHGYEVDG